MLLNIITLLFVILLVAQNGFGYGYNDCEQAQLSTQLEHGPSKSCEQKRRKGKGLVLATHRDGPHQQVNTTNIGTASQSDVMGTSNRKYILRYIQSLRS